MVQQFNTDKYVKIVFLLPYIVVFSTCKCMQFCLVRRVHLRFSKFFISNSVFFIFQNITKERKSLIILISKILIKVSGKKLFIRIIMSMTSTSLLPLKRIVFSLKLFILFNWKYKNRCTSKTFETNISHFLWHLVLTKLIFSNFLFFPVNSEKIEKMKYF